MVQHPPKTNTSRFVVRINMTTHWLGHSKKSTINTSHIMHTYVFIYKDHKYALWILIKKTIFLITLVLFLRHCTCTRLSTVDKNIPGFFVHQTVQTFWKYPQFVSNNLLQPNANTALMTIQMNKEASFEHKSKTLKDLSFIKSILIDDGRSLVVLDFAFQNEVHPVIWTIISALLVLGATTLT